MTEEAVVFGETNSLVGIVSDPARARPTQASHAVILLNSGVVHRVGPGRIYVKIARALAENGFVVLRFDFSGIGDSAVRHDNLQFEKSAISETRAAMDYLEATRGIQHFIVLGGCSGAAVSMDTACCDLRVAGALLINFPVAVAEDEDPNADTMNRSAAHYYWNFALFDPKSWGKLFTGKSNYQRLFHSLLFLVSRRLGFHTRKAAPESRQFQANLRRVADRGVPITFLSSQGDPALADLREAGGRELKRLLARKNLAVETIPGADHTFSALQDQQRLLEVVLKRAVSIRRAASKPIQTPKTCSAMKNFSLADADQEM
jgi:pimeloyl-ACP methyl ester carboxylesterase